LRLQLGVNRKSTVVRWMNSLAVRVELSKMKANEGAEKSFLTRKTRRGQRAGASGLARLRVDRGAAKLLVSAIRNAAPKQSSAPGEKTVSSRKVNHMGRKHIWALKAGNRLASRRLVQQLVKKIPDRWGYLSRSEAKRAVNDLDIPPFWRFRDWWHVYSYRCRYIGARPEGKDPYSFLAGQNPRVGGWDLDDFLSRSDLPRSYESGPSVDLGWRVNRFGVLRGPRTG